MTTAIMEAIRQLRANNALTDMIIFCGQSTFEVHSLVLAALSAPVLAKCQEQLNFVTKKVTLSEQHGVVVAALLDFCYTATYSVTASPADAATGPGLHPIEFHMKMVKLSGELEIDSLQKLAVKNLIDASMLIRDLDELAAYVRVAFLSSRASDESDRSIQVIRAAFTKVANAHAREIMLDEEGMCTEFHELLKEVPGLAFEVGRAAVLPRYVSTAALGRVSSSATASPSPYGYSSHCRYACPYCHVEFIADMSASANEDYTHGCRGLGSNSSLFPLPGDFEGYTASVEEWQLHRIADWNERGGDDFSI